MAVAPERTAGLRSRLKAFVRASPPYAPIRRMRLDRLAKTPGVYPDWEILLQPIAADWRAALAARAGPRVLIATSLGLHFTANAVDSLMAAALTLRGARVDILLCDAALPACQMVDHGLAPSLARYAREGPRPDFCGVCFPAGLRNFSPLGLTIRRFSDEIDADDREVALAAGEAAAAENLNPEGDGATEHGYAGALRFFGRAILPDDGLSRPVLARYLAAARLTELAASRLFAHETYDVVIVHHGIYAPQGLIAAAARSAGARLVTWHPSYRAGRVIFEHGDTYHRAMIDEPHARWDRPLSGAQEAALDRYLDSRAGGSQDWITFQRETPRPRAELERSLGLTFDRPTMILIGNVAWDARLHYPTSAYGEMTAWAGDVARWFAARPDLQLIVRCHPGEVMSSPRAQDRLDDAVRRAVLELPKNIAIVPPESALNTYALAANCRAALIYNTKMGVELAARGMPVIVAGDAWIRGKGFSEDASSPAEHEGILARAQDLPPLEGERLALARRYAFHFFFRRCIPVAALDAEKGWPLCALAPDAGLKARPGADGGIEAIAAGILRGSPFEYEGAVS